MKIGLIGYGSIGKRHFANLLELGEEDVRIIEANPGIYPYSSTRLVFLQPDELWAWKPDAVLICTPPATHYELAQQAILHGCHVLCEKPFVTSHAQARDLIFLNDDRKVLAVGYQLRWQLEEARGDGWSLNVMWRSEQDMRSWPSLYCKDVLEEFSHELDAAVFVNGPVSAVSARIVGEAAWEIKLQHLGCWSGVLLNGHATVARREAMSFDVGPLWAFDRVKNDEAYKTELAEFLGACAGRPLSEHLCSGAEAAHVCRIIDACRESARDCRVVHL